jgi:hypothetical protein
MNHTLYQIVDNFSKLLALEKLTVEVRQVSTASFNMRDRILTLPEYSETNYEILYFLIAHEIGHALYSNPINLPPDYFSNKRVQQLFYHVVNVLEDYRVDLLMYERYPGLMNTYNKGEDALFNRGFYSTVVQDKGHILDPNSPNSNFICRLHLYLVQERTFNKHFDLEFTAYEKVLCKKAQAIQTEEQVQQTTFDILNYIIKKSDDTQSQEKEEDADESESNLSTSSSGKSSKTTDGDSSQKAGDSGSVGDGDDFSDDEDDFLDDDDSILDELEDELDPNGETTTEPASKVWDSDIDTEAILISKKLLESLVPHVNMDDSQMSYYRFSYPSIGYTVMQHERNLSGGKTSKLLSPREKNIAYNLYKRFCLKRTATNFRNTKVFNTGELDPNRLPQYKFTENIFLNKNVVPENSNHGIVFFIDISSSMQGVFDHVKRALTVFLFFCRLAGIKYQVWTIGRLDNYYCKLKTFKIHKQSKFSTDANKSTTLLFDSSVQFGRILEIVEGLQANLCYTATDQAIFSSFAEVQKFVTNNNIEKVRSVILTDGGPNQYMAPSRYADGSLIYSLELKKNFSIDGGYSVQEFATEHFVRKFNANVVWFNIISMNPFDRECSNIIQPHEIRVTVDDFKNNPQIFINNLSDYLA